MNEVNEGDWVPLYKPNQYLAGLRVAMSTSDYCWECRLTMLQSADCGDQGFCRDECGKGGKGFK